MYHLENHFNR